MSYQSKIKRYLQILQFIEKSKFPTSAEMIDKMGESGIKVSDRQLKRDIESLRSEFGLDIHYSVVKKGYYLENEELTFPYFLKLLEFSQNMELLTSYLKEGSNIAEIIEFEDYNSFKGVQYIRDIAFFIKDGAEICLKYKRFDAQVEKEYCFQPYLLREYLNRWYVIGLLSDSNEIRTFGLDRIVGAQDTGRKFKKEKINDILSLFRNVIGINAAEQDIAEDIELVCMTFQGNLLKTLPMHASQKVIRETPDEIVFSYKLVVNFELKHRLLMMATQAKVVKPVSLKEEMEKLLREAQNFYKS
ncbi:MAG: WYL domain-containing transcriptional regulator [Mariniphaga sp.]|nr:WYL domain-containing transcriptional regulator [Mariniphaga sp.]